MSGDKFIEDMIEEAHGWDKNRPSIVCEDVPRRNVQIKVEKDGKTLHDIDIPPDASVNIVTSGVELAKSADDWLAVPTFTGGVFNPGSAIALPYVRPSWDQTFMSMATIMGRRSTCPRALKYGGIGAVLVEAETHLVLGAGYGGSPRGEPHCLDEGCDMRDGGCKRTIHAEANAIAHSREHSGSKVLYTTVSPCSDCFSRAILVDVKRIVFHHKYRVFEPIETAARLAGVELVHFS